MHRFVILALLLLALATPCLAQGEKPAAEAHRTDTPVTVDGLLDEGAWQGIDWNTGFTSASAGAENRGAPKPVEVQTRFKVLYDEGQVYIGVECDEPDADKIRADITQHDGTVWADDCVEVFFDPAADGRYYHHFLVNTKGAWYDDYGADYGLVHAKLWDCAISAAANIDVKADKWTMEIAIPFAGLELHEDAGSTWAWNVTRERHAGGSLELSSWSPLKKSFHAPKLFGTLTGVEVDFRRFAYAIAEPNVTVARTGGGVNTLSIDAAVRNGSPEARTIIGSAAIFGRPETKVETSPVLAPKGKDVTLAFPDLSVRTSLPTALVQLELRDAESGAVVKSAVKQLTADYRPVAVELLRPCYRGNIYATETLDEIVFRVKLATDVERKAGSLFLGLKSAGGEMIASRTVSDSRGLLTLPAADLAEGTYKLIVEVGDAQGKTLKIQETRIRKLPAPAEGNEVRIDEHGNILVNGEPFLGIGWYGGVPTHDPREDVVALQNLTIPSVIYPPETGSIGKLFAENGIFSVVSVENGRLYFSFNLWRDKEKGDQIRGEHKTLPRPSELTVDCARKVVEAAAKEPGLLGYYIADEPEIHNTRSDYLENFYKLLCELDPYHPVIVTNDTLDGIVTHGYKCADILSPDPYSANLDYVPNFMKRCREVLRPGQAIMLTPWHSSSQAHTTADYGTAPPYSYKVMRNQMLVALTYGARGWTGYTSSFFMPEIELRYGLPHVWRELRFLEQTGAIAAPPPDEALKIESDAEIAGWIRKTGDHVYLVLVNHKPGERSATISHPLLEGVDELLVMSEGRKVQVEGGAFTDTLAEGDARIYTTDPGATGFKTTTAIEEELAQRIAESAKPGNLLHVSRGVRATASKGYYAPWFDQYYYYAINGITDDLGWCASHAGGKPSWLELTLPKAATVGRVVIHTPNLKDYDLRLQSPDGRLHEAGIRDNEEDVVEHRFDPPVRCLKIRVTALAARDVPLPTSSAPQIAEIEAYEEAGPGPATALVSPEVTVQAPVSPIPAADQVEINALWEDDFTAFKPRDKYYWDGKDTEWVVNPESFKATPREGGGVVCTSISPKGGSAMSHIWPYDPAYRFLQVKLDSIEGKGYRFVNVGFSSSSGKPGYRGAINTSRPGIYTVDTHYVHDSYRDGTAKKCFVTAYLGKLLFTFDWMRLVKRPVNGLAVMMADGSPLPQTLKQGDELLFHVILDAPATDVTVDVMTSHNYKPLPINGQPYVQLLNLVPIEADTQPVEGDGTEWCARVKLGEGTGKFDQSKTGYPVVFRARVTGGAIKETYASASVTFE